MHYLMMIYLFKRITPADAGNTPLTFGYRKCLGDHPRRCGKYTKRSLYNATYSLSIPFHLSIFKTIDKLTV